MKKILALLTVMLGALRLMAAEPFVTFAPQADAVCLTDRQGTIDADAADWKGVHLALGHLRRDLDKALGRHDLPILAGTWGRSPLLAKAAKAKLADGTRLKALLDRELKGRREKFVITWTGQQLLIAGSDKRGTIYGIYELSQQMGVSPWWDWADVPVERHEQAFVRRGVYTDGEPAVRYRGIFLNDEAPCLSGWVAQNYGGVYNHEFYARVFELVLRLKGNFMWPAMWNSSFYADDPLNLQTADDMGVIMGTSHHEPMARAHKEWTRQRGRGPWNYDENRAELDTFWLAGVERMRHTEDLVTIGMRGNGDEPMGKNADVALLERIVGSQRALIERATGRPARETPQVWALYKEVQEYYEKGMQVPDDVILLLCDDNWGNVRILPDPSSQASPWFRRHPGGYGMYYHVDYVGAPRNSKFLNVSQVQRMWEQLQLTYDYGVDQLWILNVGDLKPMELPIDFWFRMAWNPRQFRADNLQAYTEAFCRQQLGPDHAAEAARILNLQGKYAHRRTPELLDAQTYDLRSGEWRQRVDEYDRLERDATILRDRLDVAYRTTYDELIYTPVRLMANLYRLYYAVAQNQALGRMWKGLKESVGPDGQADTLAASVNHWADQAELAFRRDGELCDHYHRLAGGKWNRMMSEIHIGYVSWNNPKQNTLPALTRIGTATPSGPVRRAEDEALAAGKAGESGKAGKPGGAGSAAPLSPSAATPLRFNPSAYAEKLDAAGATWQVIPDFGVCDEGMALLPYTASPQGASLTYRFDVEAAPPKRLTLVLAPTFPFNSGRGQRLAVDVDGREVAVLNVNEAGRHVRDGYRDQNYEWERTRQNRQTLPLPALAAGRHSLTLRPLDAGIVLEQVVVE